MDSLIYGLSPLPLAILADNILVNELGLMFTLVLIRFYHESDSLNASNTETSGALEQSFFNQNSSLSLES